ncbi:MAG TPA: hypothetical protein PK129_01265, partial [Cellvibrionaceae bacterium]|nr:hypothetical protein [Cellvibrionaceae bacterium]
TLERMKIAPHYRLIDQELVNTLTDYELETAIFDLVGLTNSAIIEQFMPSPESFGAIYKTRSFEESLKTHTIEYIHSDGFYQEYYPLKIIISSYKIFALEEFALKIEEVNKAIDKKIADNKICGYRRFHVSQLTIDKFRNEALLIKDKACAARARFIRDNAENFIGDYRALFSD